MTVIHAETHPPEAPAPAPAPPPIALEDVRRVGGRRPPATPAPAIDPQDPDGVKDAVLVSLDDDKAEEIVAIELRGRSAMADWMVVATGRSTRQVGSMADHLRQKLEQVGLKVQIEGMTQGDWVLVDAGDVIVHLFRPEVRAFYQIEKMWATDGARGEPAKAPRPT